MNEDVFSVFAAKKSKTLASLNHLTVLFPLCVTPLVLIYRERNVEVCE